MTRRRYHALALACALCVTLGFGHRAAADTRGLQSGVVFTQGEPRANASELIRRLSTPLGVEAVRATLARTGKALTEQPLDLAQERFTVYVPPGPPPTGGYGVLVFIPPWEDARLPPAWTPVLDRAGVIFVSAQRSGNDASVLGRREPLALIAAANIAQRYPVNAARVFVGGFSGGSRVAMRLAVAYPDVFAGGLLDAGADPLGEAAATIPPADLFAQVQDRSRLVYVAGEADGTNLEMNDDSLRSMRSWCVFNTDSEIAAGIGHEVATADALARALRHLTGEARPDAQRLAACRAGVERKLTTSLGQARQLVAAGRRAEAQKLLISLDRRYGGLAGPRLVALWRDCGCRFEGR